MIAQYLKANPKTVVPPVAARGGDRPLARGAAAATGPVERAVINATNQADGAVRASGAFCM